jgi:hypothetical protein
MLLGFINFENNILQGLFALGTTFFWVFWLWEYDFSDFLGFGKHQFLGFSCEKTMGAFY